MRIRYLKNIIVVLCLTGALAGCATLTPERVGQMVSEMSEFELCLATEAGMDRRAFRLAPELVTAARERSLSLQLDCNTQRKAIIDFLVRALREEESRNDRFRFHFGFGLIGGR